MKFIGLAVAAFIAAPVLAFAQGPSLELDRSPEAVLSYLFTGNFPGIPSGREGPKQGGDSIEYTEKGFIWDGSMEVTFDASDPCHPRGVLTDNDGPGSGTFTLDMTRFVTALDIFGPEGTAFMFFSGDQCALEVEDLDGRTSNELCGGVNLINFHTTLLSAVGKMGDPDGAGHFRNQRLKLAADFYKTEYCEPVPAF